jgi:hypothetical protein
VRSAGRALRKIGARQNNEETCADRGQKAWLKELGNVLPPTVSREFNRGLFADDAFRGQLRSQRNPDTIRRIDFRGELPRGCDNGRQITDKILALGAFRKVLLGVPRQRAETFSFEDGLQFLTPHTSNSVGSRAP